MPKLSVIVPVYNTEKYLRECIDSILAQTFKDFELILVDDGSTDGSGDICDEYAKVDERIRVIHQENGGITVARKSGVQAASSEYITFVDSDDWINCHMYSTMLSNWHDTLPDIIICGILTENTWGSVPREKIIHAGLYDKQQMQEEIYPIMLYDFSHQIPAIAPSFCNKIFKKKLLKDVIDTVSNSIIYGEDALCTYACLLNAKHIYISNLDLYHYRNHSESVSNGHSCSLLEKFSLLIAEMHNQFKNKDINMEAQLYGYAARHLLECIRAELLYHRDCLYTEKRQTIDAFLAQPIIRKSISYAIVRTTHFKTKIKLYFAKNNWVFPLYVAYLVRNCMLTIKKKQL